MSEIQRFDIRGESWGIVERTDGLGAFCWYEEAAWYKRGYFIAIVTSIIVSLAFGFVCSLLVYEKASHGPAPVPTMAQRHADEQIELAEAQHQTRKAEVDKLSRNLDQVSGKLDGALRLNANLKAQIHELNKLTDPSQQAETLKVAAAKMHDGQVAELAREMGFTKVRVVE